MLNLLSLSMISKQVALKDLVFLQMPDNNHAKVAMTEMGCKELGGRNIRANAGSKKD